MLIIPHLSTKGKSTGYVQWLYFSGGRGERTFRLQPGPVPGLPARMVRRRHSRRRPETQTPSTAGCNLTAIIHGKLDSERKVWYNTFCMRKALCIPLVLLFLSACGQEKSEKPPDTETSVAETAKEAESRLFRSIHRSDDTKEVEKLLDAGVNINAQDEWGDTPLHKAVSSGRKDLVQLLIENGAYIDTRDKLGRTALHEAVYRKEAEIGKILIDAGADVSVIAKNGLTPLDWAWLQCRELMEPLRKHGAVSGEPYRVALVEAISRGDLEKVNEAINNGANANTKFIKGYIPLYQAVYSGHVKIVKLLLEHGADPNTGCSSKLSLLHTAVECEQKEIIRLLLNYGADPNASGGSFGGTVMDFVTPKNTSPEIIELLRAHGAKTGKELREEGK